VKLLRCHNMIPPYKWSVESDQLFSTTLFFGTRKECEVFIQNALRSAFT
jgi:hypothetical protein